MTNKTLARILVRILGLFLVADAIAGSIAGVLHMGILMSDEVSYLGASTLAYPIAWMVGSAVTLVLGLYFLTGGQWFIEKVAGSGRSCRQCGYDLSGASAGPCPECGAPVEPGS